MGLHIRPNYYVESQRLISFAIKELGLLLHITTYYAQYLKCAAVHFRYLRIATSKVCATSSPLDLLPHPAPAEPQPAPPKHF